MIPRRALGMTIGLLALAPGGLCGQDVVRLKTGASFEGLLISETERSVTLQFPGGTMELPKSQIEEISRSGKAEDRELGQAMLTLSRFEDHESHHFLYRDGRRAGYRVLTLKREARAGVPGYAHHERLVFVKDPGGVPDLETRVLEFVDAELRPREFQCQIASGLSSRSAEGFRDGESLRIVERGGGRTSEQTAYFRDEVRFPRFLLKELAAEPVPAGGYRPFRVFLPRDLTFGVTNVDRTPRRVRLRGQIKDVVVFRRGEGGQSLETWVDLTGNVVREELGSPHLVSLVAPRDEVLAWVNGEEVAESGDLALEFVSEETGLRILRPDDSWEITPGTPARRTIVSLENTGLRATVDVIHLPAAGGDPTEDGAALRLLTRMREQATGLEIEGPLPASVGDRPGLRFTARGRRRDQDLVTLGAIVLHGRDAFAILGAAPRAGFDAARPAFEEVLDSLRFLQPEGAPPADPFSTAEAAIAH